MPRTVVDQESWIRLGRISEVGSEKQPVFQGLDPQISGNRATKSAGSRPVLYGATLGSRPSVPLFASCHDSNLHACPANNSEVTIGNLGTTRNANWGRLP